MYAQDYVSLSCGVGKKCVALSCVERRSFVLVWKECEREDEEEQSKKQKKRDEVKRKS